MTPPGGHTGSAQASWWRTVGTVCRIEQVTRPGHRDTAAAQGQVANPVAATTAAWHRHVAEDRPLLHAWLRSTPGGPVQVLSASTAVSVELPAPLLFPPGSRGRPVDAEQARAALAAFPWWVRLRLDADALLACDPVSVGDGLGLERVLLSGWPGAFAFLLLAEPLTAEQIEVLAEQKAAEERDARSRGGSPAYQVRAERAGLHHRLLQGGSRTGMWAVRFVAGAGDAGGAATVAGLLAAGLDLSGMQYVLAPGRPIEGLEQALAAEGNDQVEFPASSAAVARLVRPPAVEIPGVRVIEPHGFDVTPEAPTEPGELPLAVVLDADALPASRLALSRSALNRHTFVCGATGAGKSQTVRALLESASRADPPLPWLVIEPAKSEYAGLAGRLAGVTEVLVIRLGDPESPPVCLNPLIPEPGFPLQTHIDMVRALFLAAFDAVEPFPQILAHALTRCYQQAGFDVVLGEPAVPDIAAAWPTLGDLRSAALGVVAEAGYGREVTDNVRGFIDVRLSSLRLGTAGRFLEGGHPLDVAALMRRNVVLELEDVGADQDKAFLIGAILLRLSEHLRLRHRTGLTSLRHLTVVEEAHRLLRRPAPESPAAHAVETFAALLAEVRAYGEGLVIAEQIPTKILPDVLKNTATKIVHRLPARDDRDAVGAAMNLTETQSRQLVALPPGRAAVFTDGMDAPVLVAVPLGEPREDPALAVRSAPVDLRALTCGPACHARPCTLREITRAGRLAADPHLVLWVELLTVAHLVGEAEPAPDLAWLQQLRRHERRLLECAVSEAIQSAIRGRRTGLSAHYDPDLLAGHLSAAAWRRLEGDVSSGLCDGAETSWQAGRFRWIDVHRALAAADSVDRPHPDTETWRRRGLHLSGSTIAEQQAAYARHPDNHLPPRTVVTGSQSPPAYESATAALHPDPDPAVRMRHSLEFLHLPSLWPVTRLYPDAPPAAPGRGGT